MTEPPRVIANRYHLLKQLGLGGMGAVYQAQDLKLQRKVALKILHASLSDQKNMRDRFLQEAQSAARLRHPGIVQVHDFGEEDDTIFIVMSYIDGQNLVDYRKSLPTPGHIMPLEEALELIRQVSYALDYAHQNGVLHRDVKPSNILLEPVSNEPLPYRPVLTDLGLAKLLEGGLDTQFGVSMGTPAYVAPEQSLGQGVDGRSDVYSLGVMLYEMVTGKLPFLLKTVSEAIRFHQIEPPSVPPALPAEFPPRLGVVLEQTLQRNPADRPGSAAAFGALLEGLLHDLQQGKSNSDDPGYAATFPEAPAVKQGNQGFDQSPEPSGFSSLLRKFTHPAEAVEMDRLEIFMPEGTCHSISLDKRLHTIGRDGYSDIILDDPKVSRQHVQISFDGQHYRLMDMNSTNGTYLGKARLYPGANEIWLPYLPLRVGDHYLHLVRAEAENEAGSVGQADPIKGDDVLTDDGTLVDYELSGLGARVGVVVPQPNLTVEPGDRALLTFTIFNPALRLDRYTVALSGLPENWVDTDIEPVQLLPGQTRGFDVPLQPPRLAECRATRYPFTLTVTSQANPAESVVTRCSLTVLPFLEFNAELQAFEIEQRKTALVRVNNQGNSPGTFCLSFSSAEEDLLFSPAEHNLVIGEGKSHEFPFSARLKKARWFGGVRRHPYTITIAADDSSGTTARPSKPAHVLTGEVLSRGLGSSWVAIALLSFIFVIALSAVVLLPLLRQ